MRIALLLLLLGLGLIAGVGMISSDDAGSELEPAPSACEPSSVVMPRAIPTEEQTSEYISALSDKIHARASDARARTVEMLIANRRSVLDVPRFESTGMRIDRALTVEEAVAASNVLVEGRVVEQYLVWGTEPILQSEDRYARLVSEVETDRGTFQVEQGSGASCESAQLKFLYNWRSIQIKPDVHVAILARPSESVEGLLSFPDTHAYEVRSDGMLRPMSYDDEDEWGPLTLDELREMFADAHSE